MTDWIKIERDHPNTFPPLDTDVLLAIDLSRTTKRRKGNSGCYRATSPRIFIGRITRIFSYLPYSSGRFRNYARTLADIPDHAGDIKPDPIFTGPYKSESYAFWTYVQPPIELEDQQQDYG